MSTGHDFWQHYQLRLDPWGAEHEAPVGLDEATSTEAVDPGVETDRWAPLSPAATDLPDVVVFIDGRRRLDARLVGRDGDGPLYGAFATIAVGAVLIDRARQVACFHVPADFVPVRRILALGGGRDPGPTLVSCPLGGRDVLRYDEVRTSPNNTPTTPLELVQNAMLDHETALAEKIARDAGASVLVIRDGPLRLGRFKIAMVGYVKTLQRAYVPSPQAATLWELAPGERTPLFAIGNEGQTDRRWSWYLRSGQPEDAAAARGYHGLHGVVRLELPGWVKLAEARRLADQSAHLIPAYASRGYRDPRAPQNLTPVGALERELGRRMGDPGVIARRVGRFLALAPRS